MNSLTFSIVDSVPPVFGRKVENISRPGSESQVYRLLGKDANTATLTAQAFYADYDAAVFQANHAATFKGALATITDLSRSMSYTVMVLDIAAAPKKVLSSDGSAGMVVYQLTVERQG